MLTEHSSNLSKEFAQLNNTYQAVWPDLAKFRHFGNILKVFGQFLAGLFSIWHTIVQTLINLLYKLLLL